MTRTLRAITFSLSLALLLVTGGCSTGLKLAYDNLERLALWEIDDRIELDDSQKALFHKEFKDLHAWHRRSQLPLYAADLRTLAAAIDGNQPLGTAADQTLSKADAHGQRLWEQSKPGIERLLASVSDTQIIAYDQQQREDIDKDLRKQAGDSLDERRKRWLRDWRKGLDRWIGKLNPRQVALLDAAWARESPQLRTPEARAALRLASHERFIVGLKSRAEPGLIARLIAGADTSEAARDDAAQLRERALIASLLDCADAKQRGKLKATLLELADDFDNLAARGASVPAAAP